MLSNPNIDELMEKAGTRYETALAIAKRARIISKRRLERGNYNIKDAVDMAAKEIIEEKSFVKIKGDYVIDKSEKDIDRMISEAVQSILEDLNLKVEDTEEESKEENADENVEENNDKKEDTEESKEEKESKESE